MCSVRTWGVLSGSFSEVIAIGMLLGVGYLQGECGEGGVSGEIESCCVYEIGEESVSSCGGFCCVSQSMYESA